LAKKSSDLVPVSVKCVGIVFEIWMRTLIIAILLWRYGMVGRMARLKTLKDIGGLKLVCLKVLDRLMHEDKTGERLYNISESAETSEYPDLLEKLFKYYGGGYR
jgi:hypothetical protein